MMKDWHVVGQMVVCVDAHGDLGGRKERFPKKHEIYTVREVTIRSAVIGFLLEEIVNGSAHYENGFCELSFKVERFRPVRPTSIECFHALLNPTPGKTRELDRVSA